MSKVRTIKRNLNYLIKAKRNKRASSKARYIIMLKPHESKSYAVSLDGTKTDMSPILTTNIILTKKTPH
jgi:hypothetical protein